MRNLGQQKALQSLPASDEKYVTPREFADLHGLKDVDALYRKMFTGKVKYVKHSGYYFLPLNQPMEVNHGS